MKRIISLLLSLLCLIGFNLPAWADSSRIQWEWRDSVTAHPGFSQALPDGNVLLVRNGYEGPAVLEVNSAQEIVWEYGPIQANSAVRLSNGNTLITDSGAPGYPFVPQVVEVTPAKEVVWSFAFKSRAEAPRFADRLPNGNTLVVTPKKIMEVTAGKKEVWSYNKDLVNPVKAARLANGNTLIVDKGFNGGKVVEVDPQGKVVWQYGNGNGGTTLGKLQGPTDVFRNEDGSTTIVDFTGKRIISLDAAGQITDVTGWEDVLQSLSILNQWGLSCTGDNYYYLSVSYTNGKPALLKIDDKSFKVYCDGQWIYKEVLPVVVNGSTLVPARETFTAFGAAINWDAAAKKLTVTKGDTMAEITLDSNVAVVNGSEATMEAAAQLRSGVLMVPLRFAAQTCNVELKWDESGKTINLLTVAPEPNY